VVRYNAEAWPGSTTRRWGTQVAGSIRRKRRTSPPRSARPRPCRRRLLRLDEGRSLSLALDAPRQDLPSVQHDPGAATPGLLPLEGAALPSQAGRRGAGGLQNGGLAEAIATAAARHPDKRIELWFEDETRSGDKGRVCHRW
jgi:hypothetical protein